MRALVRGYAAVATDNGHRVADAFDITWALGHPERIADFGYRAEHVATLAGKDLTAKFYARAPAHSYFVGCSQGGHHGLMEAQRFPADYDGIVSGDPVYNWTDEMTGQAWNVRALQHTDNGALPLPKLQLLSEAVHRACGGADGLIDDPRRCGFDPGTLRCASGETSCLTDNEIEAVRRMYSGPVDSNGVQIYPGLTRGGEAGWDLLWSDPKKLGGSWLGVYRMMVFNNPDWDPSTLDFDHDPNRARKQLGALLDPDNPDLAGFAARGGKLIVYHGWADDMVPAQVSIDYHERVVKKMGGERARSFYRLFMIPGMYHCGDGPGANLLFHSEKSPAVPLTPEQDLLTALEQWVEHGRSPDEFIATRLDKSGNVERTRLVCAYPKFARYLGKGEAKRAASWTCEMQ
jgi:feruloyl esterase